jgi:hypothetical protein
VFGQAIGDKPFSPALAVLGLTVWFGVVVIGAFLVERRPT